MCDKAADGFLPTLKFVPDWFVTSKMIKELDDALFDNDDIIFINEDSSIVMFKKSDMGILSLGLNNINLDGVNFYEDDLETIIHVRLMAWRNRYKQHKANKKEINKKLIPVA